MLSVDEIVNELQIYIIKTNPIPFDLVPTFNL